MIYIKRSCFLMHKTVFLVATKEHTDLEKRHQQLQRENGLLQSQVQEKEQKLLKLRTGVYFIAEYDRNTIILENSQT